MKVPEGFAINFGVNYHFASPLNLDLRGPRVYALVACNCYKLLHC
jgi:hypothetical protein